MQRTHHEGDPYFEAARRVLDAMSVARTRDLTAAGVYGLELKRLLADGRIVRVGRGLYQFAEIEAGPLRDVAALARRAPHVVVCLLSAPWLHGLRDRSEREIWIAIDHADRAPRIDDAPLRIVRMSGETLRDGVETKIVERMHVRVFSVAKTVADCFKFRNKIGTDVALRALRDYRRTRFAKKDELLRAARLCRVERVMRPYIDALWA